MILYGTWSGREAGTPEEHMMSLAVFELCHCWSIIVDEGETVKVLPTVLHLP